MKSLRILIIATALLVPLLGLETSGAIAASPAAVLKNPGGPDPAEGASRLAEPPAAGGPAISLQGDFPLTVGAGEYDLTYLVLDFAPGSAIPLHYHGGPALVVGMEGTLALRSEREGVPEHMLEPGDVVNEKAGVRHVMINTTGASASIIALVLLPRGSRLTTIVDSGPNPPPGPTVSFQGSYPLTVAAGDYSLVSLALDFAPGAQIPMHYHGGPAVLLGAEGMLTLRPQAAPEHKLEAGQTMTEKARARHVMINTSGTNARVLAGLLLPKGAELTTLESEQTQPSQPSGTPATVPNEIKAIFSLLASVGLRLLIVGVVIRIVRSRSR